MATPSNPASAKSTLLPFPTTTNGASRDAQRRNVETNCSIVYTSTTTRAFPPSPSVQYFARDAFLKTRAFFPEGFLPRRAAIF